MIVGGVNIDEGATDRDWNAAVVAAEGDRVRAAIGVLRGSQETHRQWARWLTAHPEDGVNVGDAGFHERAVQQYEGIIETIEDLQRRVRTGAAS